MVIMSSPRESGTRMFGASAIGCRLREEGSRLVCTLGRDEAVADPRLVEDEPRVRRFGLQLLAQRADCNAQIVDLLFLCRAPHGAQQLRVGQQPAAMLRQLC